MKKIISVFVICCMLLSIAGCSNTKSSTNKQLTIGDTATTKIFNFTLNDIQFTKYVNTSLNDINYLTPAETGTDYFYDVNGNKYKSAFALDPGKKMLTFDFDIKYTGKSDYNGMMNNIFTLVYGDGYTFTVDRLYLLKDSKWIYVDGSAINTQTVSFETLSDNTYKLRGYFQIPEEVATNTSQPLKIKIFDDGIEFVIR